MKQEQDYIQDIAAIRSMMERSSKFLSLSGWSGVLAGVYALIGAGMVYFKFNCLVPGVDCDNERYISFIAFGVLLMAIITAILYSIRKARKNNQRVWNSGSRHMIVHMGVPLLTGGVIMLILISHEFMNIAAAASLVFYGLSLFSAGTYTFKEIRILGLIEIILGLIGFYFIDYILAFWAIGFGVMHIIYGAYIHFKYER